MDIEYLLRWFVGVSSVLGLIRLLQSKSTSRAGWIVVSILVLLTLVSGMVFFPRNAGGIAFLFWAVLVLAPSVMHRWIQRDLFRQNFRRAHRIAHIARILHPADGFLQYPDLLRAYELAVQDRVQEAESILVRLQSVPGEVGRAARMHLMRLRGDWDGILEWCSRLPPGGLGYSPDTLTLLLRAQGETGKLNEMVQTFKNFRKVIHRYPPALRGMTRMFVYAFSGRVEAVMRLFQGSIQLYPADIREFWIATAEMAAGMPASRERFVGMRSVKDAMVRMAVERRLAQDLVPSMQVLIPPSLEFLDQEEESMAQEERYEQTSHASFRPRATYVLIAANCLYFAVEMLAGGTMNVRSLFTLGAVVPSVVMSGGWWRLLTAQFLHYGVVHLSMNMLALYVLGPFVERHLGRFRYTMLYLICGVASFLTIVLLTTSGLMVEGIIVGASGSIMALIGATGGILVRGWAREGAAVARKRLASIVLIVALQVLFDLSTPQVSFVAHSSGTAFGFLATFLLLRGKERKAEGGIRERVT